MLSAADAVAITGVSLCNALGNSRAEVGEALAAGRGGLRPCPIELPFETATGAVDCALPQLPGELSSWSTRTTQIAALLLAELDSELRSLRQRWPAKRIAVLLGTSTAGADRTEAAYKTYLEEGALPPEYDLWRHHTYGAVLHVVRALTGAQGPALVISTACTSSAKPLASAQRMIAGDLIDAAVVGGIDTLCAMTLRGFHALDALSSQPCRPFCRQRDGLNIGEGGAFLLLERRGEAIALLEAVGESSDAYHITAPDPKGNGAFAAMQRALKQAGCEPDDVDHINAHGTGTPLNDVAEAQAIERLFGSAILVASTKGYTGHTLGAAGATEAVIALMSMNEGWVPASLGADPLDEKIHFRVATERTSHRMRRVLSNSFAFGGNNISVLLRGV